MAAEPANDVIQMSACRWRHETRSLLVKRHLAYASLCIHACRVMSCQPWRRYLRMVAALGGIEEVRCNLGVPAPCLCPSLMASQAHPRSSEGQELEVEPGTSTDQQLDNSQDGFEASSRALGMTM